MYRVVRTEEFDSWLDGLRDEMAQVKIAQRIQRVEKGLLGDWKTVHDGVSELRIDYGPGYRLYYTMRERVIVILLCGSAKRDQDRAIKLAKALNKDIGVKEI
jgi:putative addiction module killer protein